MVEETKQENTMIEVAMQDIQAVILKHKLSYAEAVYALDRMHHAMHIQQDSLIMRQLEGEDAGKN